MRLRVFIYRHEGIEPQLPTLVEAEVPDHTKPNGLRDRIKAAVTEWAQAGSEDAQTVMAYACDDFNIGDLSNCLYNDEQVGDDDDGSLVECLKRHGVENLIIEQLTEGEWTYDTPLVEPFEDDDL